MLEFDISVCQIFKMTVLNDQLCYKADIDRYISNLSSEDFKTGFVILVDKNLDRQIKPKSYNYQLDKKQNLSKFQVSTDVLFFHHLFYPFWGILCGFHFINLLMI